MRGFLRYFLLLTYVRGIRYVGDLRWGKGERRAGAPAFHRGRLEPAVREQLRSDLHRYCHQDTWGLIKLLERLRQLA